MSLAGAAGTMPGDDPSRQMSACLAAIFDAVIAAESASRFMSTLSDILSEQGLELVVRGRDDAGPDNEIAPASLEPGELELFTEPRSIDEDPRGAFVLGDAHSRSHGEGELLLRAGDSGRRQGAEVAEIAGHVSRALRLHRALVGGQLRGEATNIVLNSIPIGIILVNANARVLQVNRMAEEILTLGDGLAVDAGGLAAATPKESERLRDVVAQVATAGTGGDATPVGVLRLDRPALGLPWQVVVLPVHARRRADTVSEVAALFVTETASGRPSGIPPQALVRLFDLTPAEARLLVALIEGRNLDDAAELFGVSKNTLRNQLNQIFRKTATNKQSELVRLVLSSPAPVLIRRRPGEAEDEDEE